MGNTTITRDVEKRQAHAEALHASIVEQVQRLADSGQWRAFLEFARSFHNYSLNNLLLILAQNPEASMVAGFRQWQSKGRQVRKGEKAIKIFGYRERQTETTGEDESSDDDSRLIRYFPTLSVFDIAQTDPIEGAEPLALDPTQQLIGDHDYGVIPPLTNNLESRGWRITREPLTHASGYTDPETLRVVLAESVSVEQSAKTLIHETAHIELHHIENVEEYRQHRGRMEVEAESVAYVVAGLCGFDTSAYSIGYIAGWSDADITVIRDSATRVLAAVHKIVGMLDQ
ncbi:ArdC-like ssDNA-binding domain-containing protein [Microbacterium sp. X-17]|uniref:ArdC-like ssDNA-binding domain-containing protein n=1 Tax=Microbacterium sp. X-17 TaxID=3144404 RepID=UPI0031F49D78